VVVQQRANLVLVQVLGLGLRRRATDIFGLLWLLLRQDGGFSSVGSGALVGRGHGGLTRLGFDQSRGRQLDWTVVVQFCEIAQGLVLWLLRGVVTEVRVRRRRGRGWRGRSRVGDAGDDLGRNAGRQRLVSVVGERLLALWRLLLLLLLEMLVALLLLVEGIGLLQ
jgi:hypothetical protein